MQPQALAFQLKFFLPQINAAQPQRPHQQPGQIHRIEQRQVGEGLHSARLKRIVCHQPHQGVAAAQQRAGGRIGAQCGTFPPQIQQQPQRQRQRQPADLPPHAAQYFAGKDAAEGSGRSRPQRKRRHAPAAFGIVRTEALQAQNPCQQDSQGQVHEAT